ncbi:helix-turn-helix transcriptional regulator [uncultured Idiomarina sp.]|uniref:helix-turn-helix domain-containing protein n=1 Tax=uncultured Idiomarina sp. TaxID=352961 RepID=UPI002599C023|nr:helix-turn-helix transcriptional regulator [uncultured Idiomarina sp.]
MSNDVKLNNDKIQKLRAIKCWSQDELASASGVSVRTIQRVEKNGTASLETTKALASVFDVTPNELQTTNKIENVTFSYICKYAWLVAFAFSSVFFGLWIVDILIPTLKGADFNQQYEMHGNFRYLDFGGISFFVGFLFLSLNVSLEYFSRKRLVNNSGNISN